MKNTSTMTVDECRDELARNAGWLNNDENRDKPGWIRLWRFGPNGGWGCGHPIGNTLDSAAKLPEGWLWKGAREPFRGKPDLFMFSAGRRDSDGGWGFGIGEEAEGTTELEARFRLRVEVERSLREGGKEKQK